MKSILLFEEADFKTMETEDIDLRSDNSLGAGIQVELQVDFPVVKETLERMGVVDKKKCIIYPSCYCISGERYDVDDNWYIVHFKELFRLDGHKSTFSWEDKMRLKTITFLLSQWDLVDPVDNINEILQEQIPVVKHSEKDNYRIEHKYKFLRKTNI